MVFRIPPHTSTHCSSQKSGSHLQCPLPHHHPHSKPVISPPITPGQCIVLFLHCHFLQAENRLLQQFPKGLLAFFFFFLFCLPPSILHTEAGTVFSKHRSGQTNPPFRTCLCPTHSSVIQHSRHPMSPAPSLSTASVPQDATVRRKILHFTSPAKPSLATYVPSAWSTSTPPLSLG